MLNLSIKSVKLFFIKSTAAYLYNIFIFSLSITIYSKLRKSQVSLICQTRKTGMFAGALFSKRPLMCNS